MDRYYAFPDYIIKAFEAIYGASADEEKVEAFASRWKGITRETFRHVLSAGQGEDKVLAIFALGWMATPEDQEALFPFLHSPVQKERWATALCLGAMKDERALPYLQIMLLEGLSLDPQTWPRTPEEHWEEQWYDAHRPSVVPLLESWHPPTLIPAMRQAFYRVWELVQAGHPHLFSGYVYQDALAYALGQRGALGVLTGLDLPPPHRKTALVCLALGHLQAKEHYKDFASEMIDNDTLQQKVAAVLGQRFGLPDEEQQDCVTNYYKNGSERHSYDKDEDDEDEDEDVEEDEDEDDEEEIEDPVEHIVPALTLDYHGHSSRVNSLAWSPDGKYIASGGEDSTVKVWHTFTGEEQGTFRGHTARINVVAWAPQGRFLASGGDENTIYVWDVSAGELVCAYTGHASWIYRGLSWSPDGTRIASGSWDGTVQVWDALTGQTLLTYRGHQGVVCSVAWSPDGTRIASGSGFPECLIQIWDAHTGAVIRTYNGHTEEQSEWMLLEDGEVWRRGASSVHSLAWSPDGTSIASAGLRWVLRVWDAATGQDSLVSTDQTCGPVAWSPDGKYLLAAADQGGVDVWQLSTTNRITNYFVEGLRDVRALSWSPDGKRIAAAGGDTTVKVWEI